MAKTEWDLTNDEADQLREQGQIRSGRRQLIDALMLAVGVQNEAEVAWWEGVCKRLKIEIRNGYRANWETKKIWLPEVK